MSAKGNRSNPSAKNQLNKETKIDFCDLTPLCRSWMVLIICCLLILIPGCSAQSSETDIWNQLLDKYDKRIPPEGRNKTEPTVVNINFMIRSIEEISDTKMEWSLQVTLRQQWNDQRLRHHSNRGSISFLTLNERDKLWTPDLFFKNEKRSYIHDVPQPNLFLRIFPDGSVLYSTRLSLTLSCPMNFKLFPMDRQRCDLSMASYGWTTENIVFLWKEIDPVQVTRNLHIPHFTMVKFRTDYCNSKTNTGSYSCLIASFFFEREFAYYLMHIYIPSCMMVIISWVAFWLDKTTARVFLCVAVLIALPMQNSKLYSDLPPVSYTKAIDVWGGICIMFVFGALLEVASVNYWSKINKPSERANGQEKHPDVECKGDADEAAESEQEVDKGKNGLGHGGLLKGRIARKVLSKYPKSTSERIDFISRIGFPVMFAIFNVVYWCSYMTPAEEGI